MTNASFACFSSEAHMDMPSQMGMNTGEKILWRSSRLPPFIQKVDLSQICFLWHLKDGYFFTYVDILNR